MVGAHAVGVAVAGHLPLRRHRVLSVRQPVEQGFRQSHRPARSVDPGQRPRPLLVEFLRHHHAHVVPAVVGEGEPLAAVEVVKLAVAPAQGVSDPSGRAAALLLNQRLHTVAVPNALCHLALPIAFQIAEKRSLLLCSSAGRPFPCSSPQELNSNAPSTIDVARPAATCQLCWGRTLAVEGSHKSVGKLKPSLVSKGSRTEPSLHSWP